MHDRLTIAVFVDYDNIEIGVKSTLRREFDVALVLDALKERGDIAAKYAYANWSRQEGATRQMAENAVQMVQRIPSPRGDKNGADINLALDALEMAFTHDHVNAFAVISGDSDFIPLVNKLKEYGKNVFVVGGRAFTSTILQQNCHEFISYESLLNVDPSQVQAAPPQQQPRDDRDRGGERGDRGKFRKDRDDRRRDRDERREKDREQQQQQQQNRPAPLDLVLSMPLVERALHVLERRNVQPQLGLLKSTMLQLDSAFNESAYGARSFSDFIERLKKADFVQVKGGGGRWFIERKHHAQHDKPMPRPEEALEHLREVLEIHRIDFELDGGRGVDELEAWMKEEFADFDHMRYGFPGFIEFLNFAQDRLVVRLEPNAESGLIVNLGAEFYPPAPPEKEMKEEDLLTEHDFVQPIVRGQPTATGEIPLPEEEPKPKKRAAPRKKASTAASGSGAQTKAPRKSRRKKAE
ncbi:MAG TPA: NYN domain-containing protein [Bryobacteraceae bacterium]|nr:NYN domain-containing protein [Bryobacteraceae bacterium]